MFHIENIALKLFIKNATVGNSNDAVKYHFVACVVQVVSPDDGRATRWCFDLLEPAECRIRFRLLRVSTFAGDEFAHHVQPMTAAVWGYFNFFRRLFRPCRFEQNWGRISSKLSRTPLSIVGGRCAITINVKELLRPSLVAFVKW